MTTEDDFQRALDANPSDWQTRLVFADWLQERSDPRAEGYRALGALRLRPWHVGKSASWRSSEMWAFAGPTAAASLEAHGPCKLPNGDWYGHLRPSNQLAGWAADAWSYFCTRREAEDAAALAFAKLATEHRSELYGE